MNLFDFIESERRISEEMTDDDIANNLGITLAVDYLPSRDKVVAEIVKSREWLDAALIASHDIDDEEVYDEFRTFLTSRGFDFYRAKTTKPLASNIIFSENGTIKKAHAEMF